MITGELKSKVDKIWEMLWAGGITNPLDVIEQITYLIFIRDLDDMDNTKIKESAMLGLEYKSIFDDEEKQQYKWSKFRDMASNKMYEIVQQKVFPFIKTLHDDKDSAYSKYMDDAIFKIPTPQLLEKVVTALDDIEWKNKDIRGDLYEYMLSKISTSGTNGQFRTPRHIIKMMVEMLEPKPEDIICDPACGTGGFLVAAGAYLKENYLNGYFTIKKTKPTITTICSPGMIWTALCLE